MRCRPTVRTRSRPRGPTVSRGAGPRPWRTATGSSSRARAARWSGIGAPTWDATAVLAADEYNDVAPAGQVYVLVPVSYRNKTVEAKTP